VGKLPGSWQATTDHILLIADQLICKIANWNQFK